MTSGPSASLGYGRSIGHPVPRRVDQGESSGSAPACSPSRPESEGVTSAPLLEISNAMVRLYRRRSVADRPRSERRCPGPDMVLVLLEDAFTVTERSLLALGEIKGLRQSRLVLQQALEEQARSAVERALGRQTLAFITGVDPRRGVAVNIFTLAAAIVDNRQNGAVSRTRAAR